MVDAHTLSHQKCVPCEGGTEPLTRAQFSPYLEIVTHWVVLPGDKIIERTFTFKNFDAAMEFVNKVADIARTEDHHPDISLFGWNKVRITLSTHAIKGLSINDFVMASKIDLI